MWQLKPFSWIQFNAKQIDVYLVILMNVFPVAELVFPPADSLQHRSIWDETSGWNSDAAAAAQLVGPHPVQTVRAAEKLLDKLVVRQAGDVGGADGHLALPTDGDGLVGGGEGLLLCWRSVLLRHYFQKDVKNPTM